MKKCLLSLASRLLFGGAAQDKIGRTARDFLRQGASSSPAPRVPLRNGLDKQTVGAFVDHQPAIFSWDHMQYRRSRLAGDWSGLTAGRVPLTVPAFQHRLMNTDTFTESGKPALKPPFTQHHAQDLVLRLTPEERTALIEAINEFQSEERRQEYQGELAKFRWRSKFGRPSRLPTVGGVDPTGTYCELPDDWLQKKLADKIPAPTTGDLRDVALHNALPFIGFGFLDNFIMIVAGDYIDFTIGGALGISTMAAAALGNTVSDVAGIGSAWYVENVAVRIGVRPPDLSPMQLEMRSSRWAANMGRAFGVVVGCLLGMIPLWFLSDKDNEDTDSQEKTKARREPKPKPPDVETKT